MATLEQSVEYRGRLNQVIMSDSIFLGSQGSSDFREFYSINRALSSYTDPGTFNGYIIILKYFRVLITLDQQIDQYQRSVFSFFDMFGFLGGIFGIFKMCGSLLVQFASTRAFNSSIISKLYHVNVKREENLPHLQNKYDHLKQTLYNKDHTQIHPKVTQKNLKKMDNFEEQSANAKVIEE